jgi:uncharacterized membrane protein YbjE (DUF340 family)
MIEILIVMAAGIVFGNFAGRWKKYLSINDKLLSVSIYFLLFILGISVGINDIIIKNLDKIGLQAALITIASVAGSVAVCWLVYKIFFRIR